MKRIYTVSLDDEVPLSEKVLNEIKLLCFLIYDDIINLECDGPISILAKDGIIYNELLESYQNREFHYRFLHDDYKAGKYEPFMISTTSFGFTINDDALSQDELNEIIEHCKKMLDIDYGFTINSYKYMEDEKHKNRLITLKKILLDMESKNQKENSRDKYTKVLKPLVSSIAGVLR